MFYRWCVLAVLIAIGGGCAAPRSGATLAAMGARLERIERERRSTVAARPGTGSAPVTARLASHFGAEPGTASLALSWTALHADEVPQMADNSSSELATTSDRPGPLPGLWDTIKRDVTHMPQDLWRDTKRVYASGPNLLILGLSYGGALAVQETGPDDTIEDDLRGHDVFSDGVNETFGALGNPATHFALAGAWYLVGQQAQDEKTYNVGKKLFSALIINGASTLLGQAASWDDAPNGEWGTFPSGHTSSTFCFASVMHEEYGPLVGVPLYGLGALVAIERLDDDEHYFSDVLMGAVLGLVVGHSVAADKELELFGGKILPYADPNNGSTGVAWLKSLEPR